MAAVGNPREQKLTMVFPGIELLPRALTIILHLHDEYDTNSAKSLLGRASDLGRWAQVHVELKCTLGFAPERLVRSEVQLPKSGLE